MKVEKVRKPIDLDFFDFFANHKFPYVSAFQDLFLKFKNQSFWRYVFKNSKNGEFWAAAAAAAFAAVIPASQHMKLRPCTNNT